MDTEKVIYPNEEFSSKKNLDHMNRITVPFDTTISVNCYGMMKWRDPNTRKMIIVPNTFPDNTQRTQFRCERGRKFQFCKIFNTFKSFIDKPESTVQSL